jgi:hypothetical protein
MVIEPSASLMLDTALGYAELGWPVLPIGRGKAPLISNGVKGATTNPTVIAGWWSRWPEANIGIATGAPGPDVLDVDNTDRLPVEHRRWLGSNQPASASTGRGHHYYFKGTEERTVGMPYGELRRRGSYVVAPPSIHASGALYRWDVPSPLDLGVPDLIIEGQRSAGAGKAPEPVDHVPPGEMYGHLLDLSVRLARVASQIPAFFSVEVRRAVLHAEFGVRRAPDRDYGDPVQGQKDTDRLADAAADILEAEQREYNLSRSTRPDFPTPRRGRARVRGA